LRTGALAAHGGLHEAAVYSSDEELMAVVVPFLQDGVEAGEPTLIGWSEPTSTLLRAAAEVPGVVLLDDIDGSRARPASVIKANRAIFAAFVADGARRIRIVGEVPRPALVAQWDQWARYEAALNHAYATFPVWNICAYDTRAAPERVIAGGGSRRPHAPGRPRRRPRHAQCDALDPGRGRRLRVRGQRGGHQRTRTRPPACPLSPVERATAGRGHGERHRRGPDGPVRRTAARDEHGLRGIGPVGDPPDMQ
jgi:hypothetical protein